jgi:hypothetical protein
MDIRRVFEANARFRLAFGLNQEGAAERMALIAP